MSDLVLGQPVMRRGDIAENKWVGPRSARELERSLGYGEGRLANGWWILVLKQKLTPGDFIFGGLTLRSGGRYGLPADDPAADKLRPHVHDVMLKEYGPKHVEAMKAAFLRRASYEGPDRLVKVVPVQPHSDTMAPSEQYPMGGGGGQWTLTRPCRFLAAVYVDSNGIARTPDFSVFLGESAEYERRAKLEKYLEKA